MKHSKKRDSILNIFKTGKLYTASEICNLLPDIDRATVYRALNLFVQEGIIRSIMIDHNFTSYEIIKKGDNHQHFVCESCHNITHLDFDPKIIKKILPAGFVPKEIELNLKGKCINCN